jgi:hypothetical protein
MERVQSAGHELIALHFEAHVAPVAFGIVAGSLGRRAREREVHDPERVALASPHAMLVVPPGAPPLEPPPWFVGER